MSARYVPLRVLAEIALELTSSFDLKHQFSLPDRSVEGPDRPPTTFLLAPRRWAAQPSSLCSLCSRPGHQCWAERTLAQLCIHREGKPRGRTRDRNASSPYFLGRTYAMCLSYLPA